MDKYVLITGVAGLIGSRMADWILENKPEYGVIGVDNLFGVISRMLMIYLWGCIVNTRITYGMKMVRNLWN